VSRFRFRLQRVLGVRRLEEEIARAGFIEVETRAKGAEGLRDRARGDVEAGLRELARKVEARHLDADAVLLEQFAVDQAQKRVRPATQKARAAREAAERERRAWEERKRALKSLENLRERARTAHREEEARVDNLRLDEQALNRAERGRGAHNLSGRKAEKASDPLIGP
jgi:flagellar export protein FliJ